MTKETPLSKKQKGIVSDLQDGFVIVASSEHKGAWISKKGQLKGDYHIDNGVFWRLVKKGIIAQQVVWPFHYELTKLGKEIKIKSK